ncbi:bifunctional DNA-formamidopyrimidine glycosylase/DNA-(apurinic or apyrimidinic site) lyase [Parvularcula maris]|uniref:Formamidopyrimidine-DNA glycosylase n=1 Tax=Parvularcula maris TaxID=2965077 RepID=A0A9X2L889_9PROT|nr:bifunctional DNA-formamidopyrimidine glycosylase/DNA-(apurinic or apyrimidinic site) lyase [Parvularcula maris]MCQ8184781.1 bifunctional DNA-formamidopyrimidine glycosylase/DNA-(apurinic or apyrimidinic site) lyase [Parvularcula maris]
MPELPEVETVRRGLAPRLTGAVVTHVDQRRPDLRFPFPDRMAERLVGAEILSVDRRAKYLLMPLSTGETLLAHLGMTGRFTLSGAAEVRPGAFYAPDPPKGHEHLEVGLRSKEGEAFRLTYADPRRFGFIELLPSGDVSRSPRLGHLGPEPLRTDLTAPELRRRLTGKKTPLKAALLDQRVVAGLGNIYVCEALYRAKLSPKRQAGTVGEGRAAALTAAIHDVLDEAIEAGGSTLRDYAHADGGEGSFQQRFDVYDREGEACRRCGATVKRLVQGGRSTFYCSACQR